MKRYFQRLGKSLMLPVSTLPVAAILMGIGYWIDPTGWGANSIIAAFLLKAGSSLIDNMGLLFAIGVAIGMSDDGDGVAALAGLVAWLVITTLLSPEAVSLFKGVPVDAVDPAFTKVKTQFIGILCGILGANGYNRFKGVRLPDALSFFSGKRSVAIMTAVYGLIASVILYFIWPIVFTGLVKFGEGIISLGAAGAGIYAFFNRLLIPIGLHHALNSVFWFDIAGINDIGRFWGAGHNGVELLKQTINGHSMTGIYMTGFFPVMMFGLPGAALAMYHTAKPGRKKVVYGLLFSAAIASFFTGVTEPLEFSFMFLAPMLYLVHAVLTGISVAVCALLPVRVGFQFSAGFVDWFLSFKAPGALNPMLIIPIGIVTFIVYYVIFRVLIVKFDLKTPGREDEDDYAEQDKNATLANDDFTRIAEIVLEGVGGKENVTSLENCITRLRFEIKDIEKVDDKKIKSAGVAGVVKPSKNNVQVIVGTKVQFVADEMKKMLK